MRRTLLCIMLSVCFFILSACESSPPDVTSASVVTTSEAVVTTIPIAESSYGTAELSTTEATVETISETTTISMTDVTTSESISETVSETTVTEPPADETTTETTTVSTTAETTAPATTKITETEKPEVPVVIPEIKTPLASGVSVAATDKAEIDFSCADEGYISAVYNGKSERAKLRIKCGNLQYDHDLAADGTREFFPLMESGSYSVKVYELVTGKSYGEAVSAEFEVKIKSSTEMYLYPNKYIDFSSKSKCVKKAAELCAGADDDIEKIAAVFVYVTDTISYDKELAATVKSGYIPDPDRTLEKGKGICFDYSSLMAAMLRSQNIPTRLVIGWADPDIYHAWNEIYTEETGWITPELFLKKKGYNIADATFYAGNPDKEKISDYIEDSGNYSAVYRY
ncbi:MAG: transglutaminase domain-containing protein [Oscillospiraceae bacterium]|nr:transglutaminase domain-containing protein [Oscillospiraceae bacterium]